MGIFRVRSLELLLVGCVFSRGADGRGHVSCGRFGDMGEGFGSQSLNFNTLVLYGHLPVVVSTKHIE
jgi:hypothetical protein